MIAETSVSYETILFERLEDKVATVTMLYDDIFAQVDLGEYLGPSRTRSGSR
jgi:hypothetical protein